jgi:hypothetical protein
MLDTGLGFSCTVPFDMIEAAIIETIVITQTATRLRSCGPGSSGG